MAISLLVAVEQEDHGNVVRPMILPRLNSRITTSASLAMGDIIDVAGLDIVISGVRHKIVPTMSDVAPTTQMIGQAHRPLADFEIEELKVFGFKDME